MNLDKQAEVIAGFNSSHITAITIGAVIDAALSFFAYAFFKNYLIAFIVFIFIAVNVIAAVKMSQNLPDGFYFNFLDSKFGKQPKIYMPGENNEPE
jgi:hypothetical protein